MQIEIEECLLDFKTQGNQYYMQTQFQQAIEKFSEGIEYYRALGEILQGHEGIRTKIT